MKTKNIFYSILFWLKAIFVYRQIWLDDYDGSTKVMEFIHRKIYHRLWKWNWENGWLTGDCSLCCDQFGIIDTLGTSYEHGRFIESESSECGSIYKIKLIGFEIVLQYAM